MTVCRLLQIVQVRVCARISWNEAPAAARETSQLGEGSSFKFLFYLFGFGRFAARLQSVAPVTDSPAIARREESAGGCNTTLK